LKPSPNLNEVSFLAILFIFLNLLKSNLWPEMKQLTLIIFSLGLIFSGSMSAQQTDIRNDFYDAEFFLSEEFYRDALFSFQKVYKEGYQDNANINYRIGICYLGIEGEKTKAIPYLEKAVKNVSEKWVEGNHKEIHAPNDAWLYLGNAYRINQELDKAINAYTNYIDKISAKDALAAKYTSQQIESCKRAKAVLQKPEAINFKNLGTLYNTGLNNYNTVVSGDGSTMAFMGEQKFYNAIYFVQKVGSNWTNPVNITSQIQSDGDQHVTGLSFDGRKMYLAQISESDADIMESDFASRMWSKSRNIGKPINTKYFESHASPSPDGNTLFFTSNRNESIGGMDIFYSQKDAAGNWQEPVNIGPVINTELNEETPFMGPDGKTLYFSSQGHESIGGYDIFYSVRADDGSWSKPLALSYPLNTTDDDLFFAPAPDGPAGYLTRFVPGGYGSGDIYLVEYGVPETTAEITSETTTETGTPLPANETSAEPDSVIVSETAETTETIPQPEKSPGVTYYLRPIFFGFDSYELNENALQKLGEVKMVMDTYPGLEIEIQGNTDAMGPDSYNKILSERRCTAVSNYLSGLGVDPARLKITANSENNPVAINNKPDGSDSKDGRQLNRRVEFRILKNGNEFIRIEAIEIPDQLKINK
jgi:outer membrane protein OmpA-like peptidoglycan-associated protein